METRLELVNMDNTVNYVGILSVLRKAVLFIVLRNGHGVSDREISTKLPKGRASDFSQHESTTCWLRPIENYGTALAINHVSTLCCTSSPAQRKLKK